jgi:hypothetical protein
MKLNTRRKQPSQSYPTYQEYWSQHQKYVGTVAMTASLVVGGVLLPGCRGQSSAANRDQALEEPIRGLDGTRVRGLIGTSQLPPPELPPSMRTPEPPHPKSIKKPQPKIPHLRGKVKVPDPPASEEPTSVPADPPPATEVPKPLGGVPPRPAPPQSE